MLPKSHLRKHVKGQADHADAWLMSYADLITLLFMLFVIFVSVSVTKNSDSKVITHGEPEHPHFENRSGTLALGTKYDEAYRTLVGVVVTSQADQYIAVAKTERGITIDISASHFFDSGTADIPLYQLPVLKALLHTLKGRGLEGSVISVEGHTNDEPLRNSRFANNWELSAMRATQIVRMLIDDGMDPALLRAVSYGGNRPLVPNKDIAGTPISENRNRNQRIVIRVETPMGITLS